MTMSMYTGTTLQLLLFLILVVLYECTFAFQRSYSLSPFPSSAHHTDGRRSLTRYMATGRDRKEIEGHFLLKEFSTATGEIINPYQVLKVPRNAEKREIRDAYRKLTKRYHPDGVRFREILPGKCNNYDDVQAEWERITLSYEILSDKKSRKQYDRHEFVAYPGAAVARAAMGVVSNGVESIGKSVFSMGASVLEQIINDQSDDK
mmetsp:Transcript_272/g.309  ORF Transcript_272/g.309 Transcript_272/m.309 type:complete len:205 (+) Transcript_272:93-707(+)